MSTPAAITVDLDTLTLGDLVDLEAAGADLSNPSSPRTAVALVWVCQRKVDPSFTLDDARALPLKDFAGITGGERDPKGTDG